MKIYEITFIKYGNYDKTHVYQNEQCNEKCDSSLDVPEHMLITEDDIEFFKNYGNGIDSLKYVGDLFNKKDHLYPKEEERINE